MPAPLDGLYAELSRTEESHRALGVQLSRLREMMDTVHGTTPLRRYIPQLKDPGDLEKVLAHAKAVPAGRLSASVPGQEPFGLWEVASDYYGDEGWFAIITASGGHEMDERMACFVATAFVETYSDEET